MERGDVYVVSQAQAHTRTMVRTSPPTDLLQQIKALLRAPFGARLRGVVLYGSAARDEPRADSDVDVLVLLSGPVQLGGDLQTIWAQSASST